MIEAPHYSAAGASKKAVALPEGYLACLDDDTPPRSVHSAEELAEWERSLSGG